MEVSDRILFLPTRTPNRPGWSASPRSPAVRTPTFDPDAKYYDPPRTPRWIMVDGGFVEKLPRMVSLPELRAYRELADLVLSAVHAIRSSR